MNTRSEKRCAKPKITTHCLTFSWREVVEDAVEDVHVLLDGRGAVDHRDGVETVLDLAQRGDYEALVEDGVREQCRLRRPGYVQ